MSQYVDLHRSEGGRHVDRGRREGRLTKALSLFNGCSQELMNETAGCRDAGSRSPLTLAQAYERWAAGLAEKIAEWITDTCPAAAVEAVRTARAPSGDGGELDVVVSYPTKQHAAVQAALETVGCRWQTCDSANRVVHYGVVQHAGRIFYVHAYLTTSNSRVGCSSLPRELAQVSARSMT